ncbi:MAG: ABC transporter substrate-binding protein [Myxococcota bacterium]|nr:ABC transporter substrate-binding protein [Myxococcota bacterium]MEE2780222.1 ABC transporter substrate-binding protein [Myxococcota bacterium]
MKRAHRLLIILFLLALPAPAVMADVSSGDECCVSAATEIEAPCKKLIGAVRYNKDEMGLKQLDGEAQGAFLAGAEWAKATAAQRQEFVKLFHGMFAGIAFPRIRKNFENLETILYDAPAVDGDKATLGSTIVILHPMKKQEIRCTYDLKKGAAGWQVVDVTIQGDKSMLTNIRNDQVQPLLAKKGWDGILEAMRKRVAKLKK